MLEISFSYNWNKKLDCNAFTTLRLSDKYKINDIVKITCKKSIVFNAKIVDKKVFTLDKINNFIAYLDTGYDMQECKNILMKMYKNKNINWETQKIYFYLIKKIKE